MVDRIGQQLGNYKLLRVLGQGAFATVYLGEHQYLERPAAIKVLHVQMDSDAQRSFQREARTIAQLHHPHIIDVYDFGVEDQIPYLVMEYSPGGMLRSRHPKETQLSFEQIVRYVKQIAPALDYAHQQHVIHRDVKPENLLLNAGDDILLSDFGLAVVQRTLDSLSSQKLAGTPVYMAPEQIQHTPSPASDQYALGIIVYEWLCGEPPFRGSLFEVFSQHLHAPPPSLRERLPQLPRAVEDAVFGALAKDPRHRFSCVQDFALALEEACFVTQPLSAPEGIISTPQVMPSDTLPVPTVSMSYHTPAPQDLEQPSSLPVKSCQIASKQLTSISIVSVCALADRSFLEQWEAHLRPLEQAKYFTIWSENRLLTGTPRQQQIDEHLDQADLIVLLVSADFFASDDCYALMQQALSSWKKRGTHVVPLLLRPVEWQASPLASFSCVPSNGLPVVTWINRDAAFDTCVRDICRLLGRPMPSTQTPQQTPAPSSVAKRNRKILLRRVRSFWIEGVLSHSLHGAALLALGLETQPDAVVNPWHLVLQHPDTTSQQLPTGTRITQVYDHADGELLILGAPGSGKTTLLLELARDLLDRAERDEQHPMPVVFNLSSWAMKQQHLTDWLIEELNTKYRVPRKLAQALVEADQILPLLDGLDEVVAEARTTCIETINTYRQEHSLLPLVVCSRSADYLAQTKRVLLQSAVAVQSLTEQQVADYLAEGGEALWALRIAWYQDAELHEFTDTPLMLSILTLTYQGMSVEDLLRGISLADRQQRIFERYVARMLRRRGVEKRYTPEQTTHWLSWLARQMKQHSQSIFYLEQLQPSWLSGNRRLRVYDWLAVRVPDMLMGVLVSLAFIGFISGPQSPLPITCTLLGGLLGGLLSEGRTPQRPTVSGGMAGSALGPRLFQWLLIGALIGLGSGLSAGLDAGLVFGLLWGVSSGLCSILLQFLLGKNNTPEARSQAPQRSQKAKWQRLLRSAGVRNGILVGLSVGLGGGLSAGLGGGLSAGLGVGLGGGLSFGSSFGLSTGLSAGVLSVLLIGRSTAVQPTDLLVWSWRSLGKSLFSKSHASMTVQVTILIGLGAGLSGGLSGGLSFGLSLGLSTGLSFGLSFGLLLGLFQGVSSATIEDQRRVVPNQGIRRSALNGLVLGLISAVIVGLIVGLSYELLVELFVGLSTGRLVGLSFGLSHELPVVLSVGLSVGLLAGLHKGGLPYLRHYVLRFLLWRTGSVPWHYVRFLDEAVGCILLRKVGGGYIFVHRLILDYFASLDTPLTKPELPQPSQAALPRVCSACRYQEERPGGRFCAGCGKSLAS